MSERARNKGGVGRSGRPRRDLRLFVAAYPGKAWSDRAIEGLGLLDLPPHRVTPAEQVHLTLCFLGSVDRARLPGITESVGLAASGLHAFDLDPTRLITLPERGPARLFWKHINVDVGEQNHVEAHQAPDGPLEQNRVLPKLA